MTKEIKFFSKVTNGKLAEGVFITIRDLIAKMEGKNLVITIKEQKRQRSQKQSRFYRGVVIPVVREVFYNAGRPISAHGAHVFCKVSIGGMSNMVQAPSGEWVDDIETSVNLTTEQWEIWINQIRAWVAEWGQDGEIVPFPNENLEPPSWINEQPKEYRV